MNKILFSIIAWMVAFALNAATGPSVGEVAKLGNVGNLEIEVVVQSPSAQETPLQIVCLFEYSEGDIFKSPPALPKDLNGMVHVDEAMKGLITDLRKSNRFEGKLLETLLIIPPAGSIPAKKLLLIGLGNRKNFNADIMRLVGIVGMREALRLGVSSYSHASDLKDAGIDSSTGEVAGNVVKGALEAFGTHNYLKEKNASEPLTVTKLSLLSGPAYFEDSKNGIEKIIKTTDMSNSISENNGLSLITDWDKTIYSVGISTGGIAEIRMAKAVPNRHIIATTIDPAGVKFAQDQIEQAGLSDRIEVKLEDISKPLPYENGYFDFVYARLVLHYLPKSDLENALKELYRVLKPGGRMFVVVRSTDCLEAREGEYNPENCMTTYSAKNGGSYSRFFHSPDSIIHFLTKAGFQIQHVKTYDEQLYVDFQRTKLSNEIDNLIEVFASKKK